MGAIHGRGYYDRIGLSEACFSGARGRCRGSDGSAQAASACASSGVLQSSAALSGWPGGVWDGALLGARVACAWPRGASDAGAIREGLRQAQQERRGGCRGDLRGGCAADDAVCGGEDGRAQAAVLLHRGRERLVRQRTGLVNALRAHLAEFGIIAPQGLRNVGRLTAIVRDEDDARLPDLARQVLEVLAAQIEQLEAAVAAIE